MQTRRFPWLTTLALLSIAAVAAADTLVLRDGSQIETDGPWEERGRLIRFTTTDGTLGSIRTSEVDFEATEALRQAALQPVEDEAPAEEVSRGPAIVITNADIPQARSDVIEFEGQRFATGALRVDSWNWTALDGDPAYELTGTIRNGGSTEIEAVELYARIVGVDFTGESHDDVALMQSVKIPAGPIPPGESREFRHAILASSILRTGNPDFFADPQIEFDLRFDEAPDLESEGELEP